ncbi:hypothetical protein GCM10022399_42130 [Terrabacter ginsenosidimutans]|uniref:Uncharacterized protein n=1 Tax=Terrabacter ginsenosidimutans TaxID=490575 RepID=A0ABP7EMK8_9MICO
MLIVLSVAAAAALVVVAYRRLREQEPETARAGLSAVRDLADVVPVCVKAIEGVVEVLSRPARVASPASNSWADDPDYDLEDEPL